MKDPSELGTNFSVCKMFHKTSQALPKAESFLVYAFGSGEIKLPREELTLISLKKKSHVGQICFSLKNQMC